MFTKLFSPREAEATSIEHHKSDPTPLQEFVACASSRDLRRHIYFSAISEFSKIQHFDHGALEKVGKIILRAPELLLNKAIQTRLVAVFENHKHWKDPFPIQGFINQIQPVLTPSFIDKASSSADNLKFLGILKKEYLSSTTKVAQEIHKSLSSAIKIVDGYRTTLHDGVRINYESLQNLVADFQKSYFGKDEKAIQNKLQKILSKWDLIVAKRLKEIEKFRKRYEK